MSEAKPRLIIVEDDLAVAEMLTAYFNVQDYEVVTVNLGIEAIRECRRSLPDLIILNIHLPDMDGCEVVRRIRKNHKKADIPFIFLTNKGESVDQQEGLKLGVTDYVNIPFDVQDLRLNVRNALHRSTQNSLTNPVTGLPEGLLVDEHLNDCLETSIWTLFVASLANLDNFRKVYGDVASDDVLRGVSQMIQGADKELGDKNDFLGHFNPACFILITSRVKITPLQERIQSRVTQSLDYYYPIKDRDKLIPPDKRVKLNFAIIHADERFYPSLAAIKEFIKSKLQ
jgi:DNA-binding response OmpR family regulator